LTLSFEAVSPRRRQAWSDHYRRYARALGETVDDAIVSSLWSWLLTRTHGVEGLLALDGEERLVGFAHFRPFPRTLNANEACFLDDLWVAEAERGAGVGDALVEQVCAIARSRGWSEVRWVTDQHNARARRLYDRIATDGRLVTYRIQL
jgi:ribosomal protein S18 acetylase RimI-like enzyme